MKCCVLGVTERLYIQQSVCSAGSWSQRAEDLGTVESSGLWSVGDACQWSGCRRTEESHWLCHAAVDIHHRRQHLLPGESVNQPRTYQVCQSFN